MAKSVRYIKCVCGKRGFFTEEEAHKALGKAQAKRNRQGDAYGSRRGLKRESRVYLCDYSDLYHLTDQSQRVRAERVGFEAAWGVSA